MVPIAIRRDTLFEDYVMRTLIVLVLFWFLSALAHAELNVFACEPEWASLVKEIGGDKVNIDQTGPGIDMMRVL